MLLACQEPSAIASSSEEFRQCQSVGKTSLRRLTQREYALSLRDLLQVPTPAAVNAFPADDLVSGYQANLSAVSELQVDLYQQGAQDVLKSFGSATSLTGCGANASINCLTRWLPSFLLKAYRRPAAQSEQSVMETLMKNAFAQGPEAAVRTVLEAALQSPQFLYHTEGLSTEHPLDYAAASGLSYFLWATMPDDALFEAANKGLLSDPAQRRAQVLRLLNDSRAVEGLGQFHRAWLDADVLRSAEKEPSVIGSFDETLKDQMLGEISSFSSFVIRQGTGRLESLLTADFTVAEAEVLALYGVQTNGSTTEDSPTPTPKAQRSGLLTTPAFLASHAHRDQTSPVKRGYVVRDRFFCQQPTPPPPNVNNSPPALDFSATTKERFAAHTENPACAGCHTSMDPIGWGLESFDAVGRYRSVESGRPVDAAGQLSGTDVDGDFVGPVELGKKLAHSRMVQDCVALQWFHYAARRLEGEDDACVVQALKTKFEKTDGSVKDLIVTVAESPLFLTEGTAP